MQLLEMVEHNELNRSFLTLLDENIANAHKGNQVNCLGKASFILPEIIHFILCLYFWAENKTYCSQL